MILVIWKKILGKLETKSVIYILRAWVLVEKYKKPRNAKKTRLDPQDFLF